MAMPLSDPPGFDTLDVEDQLTYLMDLWDRISADPNRVPLRPSHVELALERLTEHRADPEAAEDGFAVLDRLRTKHR